MSCLKTLTGAKVTLFDNFKLFLLPTFVIRGQLLLEDGVTVVNVVCGESVVAVGRVLDVRQMTRLQYDDQNRQPVNDKNIEDNVLSELYEKPLALQN